MLIDNKGRLVGKINILDLLIIFIIAVGVSWTAYRYMFIKTEITKPNTVMTVLEVWDLPAETAAKIKVGDVIKSSISPEPEFGVIEKIEKGDAQVRLENPVKGTVSLAKRQGSVSMKIYCVGKAKYSEEGVTFGDESKHHRRQGLEVRASNVAIWAIINDFTLMD